MAHLIDKNLVERVNTALLLGILWAALAKACTQDNAVEVMYVPNTFANPVTCFMHGQAYLAETSIGLDLAQNEAVKVICMRGRSAQDALPVRRTKAQAPP